MSDKELELLEFMSRHLERIADQMTRLTGQMEGLLSIVEEEAGYAQEDSDEN